MIHSFNIKTVIIFIALASAITFTHAQTNVIPRHHLSVNLAAGILSGEVGLYYDYRLSEHIGLQLSYGHRFYSFNMIINGGKGFGYKYFPQQGDLIRIGLKRFFTVKDDAEIPLTYLLYRLSFWNLHTPVYITRYGINILNSTPREVISVDKNVGNLGFGVGKEIYLSNSLYMDVAISFGISIGEKKTHKYFHGNANPYAFQYPENTFEKTMAVFPTVETGFKIGFYR